MIIPNNAKDGIWIGRCFVPSSNSYNNIAGPHVVMAKDGKVYDLSPFYDATAELINCPDFPQILKKTHTLDSIGNLEDIIQNSIYTNKDENVPYFLAPNDLQAIKACGVTFIDSLLERVIEEKAQGNPEKAFEIRETLIKKIGTDLSKIVPGSEAAELLKIELQNQGIWSQYLEVGIGKDAEIFTKSQPLSAVGYGAQVGVLEDSNWNNPEPEVVLVVNNNGQIIGATLGNDVNLRDYEGRSALLLGEAKDQNGSCAIGPMFRLFDESFTLSTLENEIIDIEISGTDAFHLKQSSHMSKISRSPQKLVNQAIGKNHQYPDGLVLFCGTMFAPTKDRNAKGQGFTHHIGDAVTIRSKHLGTLQNWVNHCHQIPKWEYGTLEFIKYLKSRR
ncbi:fumarylacetoacetate (FAA) hydrolase family protein [Jejuia pallidilutea]|uniref:Fumarylacetoacetate (FAA) hydrolase family protein n=1 Tax=Jejuia pallidilutea TaxID=504487 RepID=A0A362X4W6_9FLAO|nr:fumarylacetoacetate hydrolase family protein [Jejuia pallidilutea]PQV51489.1 fumarylacetoacetate (FAA) hydrolase family protein [Jejuia pallidilutea]